VDPGWTGGVAPPGEEGGVVDPGWTGGTVPPELEGGPVVPDEEPVVPDEEPVPDQPAELSASFTYDRPVMGADTQFDATASTGSIETYDWTFAGAKQSDAGPTPTWQFAKNGTYTVKLVVTDADGVTATDSQSVKVLTA
jgi:PKD repeat protein